MKKEITYVPKGKSLEKFLKEKFKRGQLKNAWLFLDEGIYREMLRLVEDKKIRNSSEWCSHVGEWFWIKTFELTKDERIGNQIWIVKDEEFEQATDPEQIFFLKMEE